jgi:hypothetical protein
MFDVVMRKERLGLWPELITKQAVNEGGPGGCERAVDDGSPIGKQKKM